MITETKKDTSKYCECCGELTSEIQKRLKKATPKHEVKVVQVRRDKWHKQYNEETYFYNTGQSLYCSNCGNKLDIKKKDSYLCLHYKCKQCNHEGGLN